MRRDPEGQPLPESTYVFGNEVGEQVQCIRAAWHRALKAAGTADLHFHDLRREAGLRMLEAGIPIHVVRQVLGHKSLTQTNTYLRAGDAQVEEAFGVLDAAKPHDFKVENAALRARLAVLEAQAGAIHTFTPSVASLRPTTRSSPSTP